MTEPRSEKRWRVLAVATLRCILTSTVLIVGYYVLPLDPRGSDLATFGKLGIGVAVFIAVMTWHLRLITESDTPALRAVEGMCLGVPLFLLVFASTYFLMSESDPLTFSEALSRSDSLYLTITVFATVGFGDITPKTEAARLLLSAQMLLDLVVLGIGVRVILAAVDRGRERISSQDVAATTTEA